MAGTQDVVDLSNYKDRVGARVAPGRYEVVVDDTEMDTARSGNTMYNVWFRIEGGEFEGASVTDRLVNTEKALFRIVGFLQAIGHPTPKKKVPIDIGSWVGKRLEIDVDDGEPYQGRVKSEVRGYIRSMKKKNKPTEELPADEADSEIKQPKSKKSELVEDSSEEVELESLDLG